MFGSVARSRLPRTARGAVEMVGGLSGSRQYLNTNLRTEESGDWARRVRICSNARVHCDPGSLSKAARRPTPAANGRFQERREQSGRLREV